jgi:hypothetical protein
VEHRSAQGRAGAREPGGRLLAIRVRVGLTANAEGRLAQLEQVAKKVEACLKVGGASLSDIIETRTYVADPDQLAKYVDICKQFRQRFTGPDDPQRGRAFRPRQPHRSHGLRRDPVTEEGPASMKSSPLKSFEHSVARRLRAELRGEGMANYFLRRYSEAVDACDRALARNPGLNTQMLSHPMLAATYAEMGRQQARRTD